MNSIFELLNALAGLSHNLVGAVHVKGILAGTQLPDLLFFREINGFLSDEISEFRAHLLGRTASVVGVAALSALTLWIVIQGYRIVTGQSREPMMALVVSSLRAVLIVGVATGAAATGNSTYKVVTDGLSSGISHMVTGNDDDVYGRIDKCLAYMQVALSSIDALDVAGDQILDKKKDRAIWFTGIGTGGPAVMAGIMLMMNKVVMALIIGLGPLFILCLLFEQTKNLFGRWLYYGIGTMFSLAVLSVMVTMAMDMVLAVSASFWASSLLGAGPDSVNSMALQQGGLGVVLTTLIMTTPPMAANFFQGTLGTFSSYNQLLTPNGGQSPPGAYGPGSPPMSQAPANPTRDSGHGNVGNPVGPNINQMSNSNSNPRLSQMDQIKTSKNTVGRD